MSEDSKEWEDHDLESIPPLPFSMTTGSKTSDQDRENMSSSPVKEGEEPEERSNQIRTHNDWDVCNKEDPW